MKWLFDDKDVDTSLLPALRDGVTKMVVEI